ncbi:DUF1805 domain-containing protein [Grimontia sp. SpTr1]|uniref:DUF1805 domain-containing protein n=1 Tax=Grimontia sp. SpTr1 TaxID=2995319 RepID=UPI00248C8E67|nr:DUF1805 domain-containing protein [Grimontia sp. SpTr1]
MKRKIKMISAYAIFGIALISLIGTKVVGSEDSVTIGKPLASLDYYPITYNDAGKLYLDKDTLNTAITQLDPDKHAQAAWELIQLIEDNSAIFMIDTDNSDKVSDLKKVAIKYDTIYQSDREEILESLKDIVKGFGKTLSDTPIEVVLHDTTNPLISVIAIENPITGRRMYDPNTNFGLELIKKYARNEIQTGNIISYPIQLPDGMLIKATTIPVYHNDELIAFICINIDTTKITKSPIDSQKVIDALVSINPSSQSEIEELLQPISEGKKYMQDERINFPLERPLLVIKGSKGFLACAYINIETCNKLNEACAIVSGVSNYDDMMNAKIVGLSDAALDMGLKIGDLGSKATEIFR